MERRGFLQAGLGTAALASLGSCSGIGARNSQHLVATLEAREAYLRRLLKEICTDIGPRPLASPEYDRAAAIVKRELELAAPDVSYQTFPVDRWVVKNGTMITVGDKSLESYLFQRSPGTSPEGFTGIVIREGTDKDSPFQLIDKVSGEVKAYIFISPQSRVYTRFYLRFEKQAHGLPGFTIASDDLQVLLDAEKNGTPVTVYGEVEWMPDTPTSNVIGTLPGETADECVFIAHLDSVYIAPGANDNLATLILMLMWGHAFSGTRPKKTLTFLAAAGEEVGFLGAKHFVKARTEDGTIDRVKYVFNFDSFTWGPELIVFSDDEQMKGLCRESHEAVGVDTTLTFNDQSGYWLDAGPFEPTGCQALSVSSTGSDVFHNCWHQTTDTPEHVNSEWIEMNFHHFTEFIRRLQEI